MAYGRRPSYWVFVSHKTISPLTDRYGTADAQSYPRPIQDAYSGADHLQATRGDDYAFIYAATGKPFTLNLGKITGSTVVGWWFDPRNGSVTLIGELPNSGAQQFRPPGEPRRGNDWVLVLDDKAKGFFSAPGAPLGSFRATQGTGLTVY